MPKIKYQDFSFRKSTLEIIQHVNEIISRYRDLGYSLTLRQVYYQLVTQNLIENSEKSYKSVGNVVNDGRLAGYIDWNAIEDRTRNLRKQSHFYNIPDFIRAVSRAYHVDRWSTQDNYVEVWVEKDALVDIVGSTCTRYDVPYFSCRGYVSQSEMWSASQRIIHRNEQGQEAIIIHLGDHDPSGIDMTRDIQNRLSMFGADVSVDRVALSMEQIEQYSLPPNPAKLTDSRATDYVNRYGYESWELDALRPEVLDEIIVDAIHNYLDVEEFDSISEYEKSGDIFLKKLSDNFNSVEAFLGGIHRE